MNILDTIIAYKREEVEKNKINHPVTSLRASNFYQRNTLSLQSFLTDTEKTGIIAEFKRRSPSKGVIHPNPDILSITKDYMEGGASGLSILTDQQFFGGSNQDLINARMHNIPILRKEFIIDTYQIEEAKSIGADAILLIAACLTKQEVKSFSDYANNLGLEVLLELHGEDELDHICAHTTLIGINNRNLKTFEVDIDQSIRMAKKIDSSKLRIAESGIHQPKEVSYFKEHGFHGFLIGEQFMKQENPGEAFKSFVAAL